MNLSTSLWRKTRLIFELARMVRLVKIVCHVMKRRKRCH